MIYIVTGDIETGKSTRLHQWIKTRNDVYGILTLRDENNERYLLDVQTKAISPMQAKASEIDTISIGRYNFYKTAFKKANSILKGVINEQGNGFILIDELGKLELNEEGLHASALSVIEKTRRDKSLHSVLVIRTSLLLAIKKKYNLSDKQIFNINSLEMLATNM